VRDPHYQRRWLALGVILIAQIMILLGATVVNVAQQLGAALGVAIISTFVASATNHYLTDHGSTAVVTATVHGFTVGYWWAAGAFWAGAVICRSLIRGGTRLHPEGGEPEPLDEISGLF
jgi:NADH:ubiquinone oxidoreductase subunit 6 (subunit J)